MNDRFKTYVALELPVRVELDWENTIWKYIRARTTERGFFLIPQNVPNPADYIHFSNPKNTNGYGGKLLIFRMGEISKMSVQGPWHTNSHHLLGETGIDLREQHHTWGFVYDRVNDFNRPYAGIDGLYFNDPDGTWVLGRFNRIENMAIKIATELGRSVQYYKLSQNGSASGTKNPGDTYSIV
jgi:hypothetical protein